MDFFGHSLDSGFKVLQEMAHQDDTLGHNMSRTSVRAYITSLMESKSFVNYKFMFFLSCRSVVQFIFQRFIKFLFMFFRIQYSSESTCWSRC